MKLRTPVSIVLVAFLLVLAFVAGQNRAQSVAAQSPPTPNHPRWEYSVVSGLHIVQKMNELGDDGWEAVSSANNRVIMNL